MLLNGATVSATGVVGGTLSLDGFDDYVEVPDSAALSTPTELAQEPRPLQENATNRSMPQPVQRNRAKSGLMLVHHLKGERGGATDCQLWRAMWDAKRMPDGLEGFYPLDHHLYAFTANGGERLFDLLDPDTSKDGCYAMDPAVESDKVFGDTCGFYQPSDQVNVTAEQLNLGPLQDNGGPTMTHALGTDSVAIDVVPEADCVDADAQPLTTDQRGQPRPAGSGCDVGAFEVQP